MSDSKSNTGKKTTPRRPYAFGGCGTCRRRHVKCDQVRPICLTCRALGTACEGFDVQLTWINLSKPSDSEKLAVDDHRTQVGRRHLYTERLRASMAHALQSGLASRTIDESLSELDARSKSSFADPTSGLNVGPFGVFSLGQPLIDEGCTPSSPQLATVATDPTYQVHFANQEVELNAMPSVESFDSFNPTTDLLDWSDLFDLEFNDAEFLFHRVGDDPDHTINAPNFGLHPSLELEQDVLSENSAARCSNERNTGSTSVDTATLPDAAVTQVDLNDAQLLLKHFKDNVIPHIRTMPLPKRSPWQILHLEAAILTLVRLTSLTSERVTHAAVANLQALLALSSAHLSLHLARNSPGYPSKWQEYSESAIKAAKTNLQQSLKDEFEGSNRAKYKDQLMSIMAMLALSVVFDKQREARAYMIDAERLLRLRGLGKRTISRRARLLHHMYTWTRIVDESTYVLGVNESGESDPATSKTPQRRGHDNPHRSITPHMVSQSTRLDDFLRLEKCPTETEINTQPAAVRRKFHLLDIHLEEVDDFPEALYSQLYGIAEPWLRLISQTTRLANTMSYFKRCGSTLDDPESLDRRRQHLEDRICNFAGGDRQRIPYETYTTSPICWEQPAVYMQRALNTGLIIFFYRRIRDVSPFILQDRVDNVIQALKDFDLSCQFHKTEGPGCPWPAFIAGSEAMTRDQRDYFSGWLERAAAVTGFTRFLAARNCIHEVWNRRDHSRPGGRDRKIEDQVWSWVHVCREQRMHILLS